MVIGRPSLHVPRLVEVAVVRARQQVNFSGLLLLSKLRLRINMLDCWLHTPPTTITHTGTGSAAYQIQQGCLQAESIRVKVWEHMTLQRKPLHPGENRQTTQAEGHWAVEAQEGIFFLQNFCQIILDHLEVGKLACAPRKAPAVRCRHIHVSFSNVRPWDAQKGTREHGVRGRL